MCRPTNIFYGDEISWIASIVLKWRGATRDLTFMFWIIADDCACGKDLSVPGCIINKMNYGVSRQLPATSGHIKSKQDSFPLKLYDIAIMILFVIPCTSQLFFFLKFMSASRQVENSTRLNWGVMGGVKSVPTGFVMETLVVCNSGGINQVNIVKLHLPFLKKHLFCIKKIEKH